MSIPQLQYAPSSQNQRVSSFEIASDEQPRIYTTENLLSATEMDELITAAYRQVFHEQQMLSSTRQAALESQLRSNQLSVKNFIRGLATSDAFRRLNYEPNNNYRFVELCVQRLLGRNVYSDREKLSWSTVVATKGVYAFIDQLLSTEEYQETFGEHTVPYQRRRILPQRSQGELPFARTARYDDAHLQNLLALGSNFEGGAFDDPNWRPPEFARQVGAAVTIAGAGILSLGVVALFLSWFGLIRL